MDREKITLKAKVYGAEVTPEIQGIAEKVGIVLPSSHTAIFRTVYAPIEEANGNGVRLAKKAVDKALPGLIGSQVNLEHLGKGFMVGIILDASVNEKDEIETIFTFAKNIYEEDFIRALEKMQEGTLSVSFELLASREGQEMLQDGTIRLHDIDFQGQGLLIDETPAYKNAIVFDMAKKYKARAMKEKDELVYANQIVEACDKVLSQEDMAEEPLIFIITTNNDNHFHIAEVDFDGNGETVSTMGPDDDPHTHKIVTWQIQEADGHAHQILTEIMAKVKEIAKRYKSTDKKSDQAKKEKTQTKQGGNTEMTEEQKKKIADLRAELGDFAKDVSDEKLLDETEVEALRKAKADDEAEAKPEAETKEEKKEDEPTDAEKAKARIAELEAENAELKATIEAKDSEIESVRENAEKVGKLKIELKDNPYVAEFKDEDYLDEGKVAQVKIQKENDDLKARNEKLAKENQEAKDKIKASQTDTTDEDLETGHSEDKTNSPSSLINRLK